LLKSDRHGKPLEIRDGEGEDYPSAGKSKRQVKTAAEQWKSNRTPQPFKGKLKIE